MTDNDKYLKNGVSADIKTDTENPASLYKPARVRLIENPWHCNRACYVSIGVIEQKNGLIT